MWTKDRPKEPGHYWYRSDKDFEPRIHRVFCVGGLSPCLVIENKFAENGILDINKVGGEWWPYAISKPSETDGPES